MMDNKVSGRIVRNDNGNGIPNLAVVIFDIDLGKIEKNDQTNGFSSSAISGATPVAAILPLLFGPAIEEDGSLRGDAPAGDRIASVLTDDDGKFEISFTDDAFQIDPKGINEKRPDVLLAVIGPDISIPINGSGFGLPEFKRLVHLALYPRWNAGRQECFFIKVPEDLFEIAGLKQKNTKSAAQKLKDNIELRNNEKEEITKVSADAVRAVAQKNAKLREKSKPVTKKILSNLTGGRGKPYFLSGALTANERKVGRVKAIESAQKIGLDRMSNAPNLGAISLFLPKERLKPLLPEGIDLTTPSSFDITIDTACGLINATAGGQRLVRSKTIKSLLDSNQSNTNSPDNIESDPVVDDGDTSTEDLSTLTPQARIQRIVEEQVRDMTLIQDESSALDTSTLSRLHADLNNAVINPGPADTTSFHDFHTLQIAFENVWTEALSGTVENLVTQLHEHLLRQAESGDSPIYDDIILAETTELNELMDIAGTEVNYGFDIHPSEEARGTVPDIYQHWAKLDSESRNEIEVICLRPYVPNDGSENITASAALFNAMTDLTPGNEWVRAIKGRRAEVSAFISSVIKSGKGRLERLLIDLAKALNEPYCFSYFEKNTINYGVVSTYRQTWEPGSYQVGSLVKTIPLAPGEARSFEVKQTTKKSRARKEIDKNSSSRSFDSSQTSKIESEVIERAEELTNFSTSTKSDFKIFNFADIKNTTSFKNDQTNYSKDTKKSFREAVLKSAQEVKSETNLEVNTTEEIELINNEKSEIKNPNNEMTVTYLLYELERQYKISEKIHSLTPVIMVAQEMPPPDGITESWLIRHDWIIKRVLLDQRFLQTLNILTDDFVADEVAINIKKSNWETQKEVTTALKGETSSLLSEKKKLHEALITLEYDNTVAEEEANRGGFLHKIAKAITPFNPMSDFTVSNTAARVDQAKSLLEIAEQEFVKAAEKLSNSTEALNSAAQEYSKAIESITHRRTLIDQLRIHIKDNILHYMQAIWSYEPNDQRYFRLYKEMVFFPTQSRAQLKVRRATAEDSETVHLPGTPLPNLVIEGLAPPKWAPNMEVDEFGAPTSSVVPELRPLHEVADLDKPLGFKGNYMLFPMQDCNLITDYMMAQFVDGYFGIRDPDALSEFTNDELASYSKSLKAAAERARGDGNVALADKKDGEANLVTAIIGQRLDSTYRDTDTIAMPTGQIYMEALVGKNTLLEPFKLAHRGYDALSAKEDLRRKGLENLRYAARMVGDDPNFDDPEIDTNLQVNNGLDTNVEIDA
jgi:hypothetical protein